MKARISVSVLASAALGITLAGLGSPAQAAGSHQLPGSVPAWANAAHKAGATKASDQVDFRVYLSWRGGNAAADYATEEEFELAVSATGSLGVRAMLDSRTVSVVASAATPEFAKRMVLGVRRLSTVGRGRLLDDLAGVEVADSMLRLPELAQVAAEDAAGISIAFLICGSTMTAAQLRAAAAHFPLGVDVVAIVCDEGAVPSMRRVSDLSVLTIGYLEDLQRSLAKRLAT